MPFHFAHDAPVALTNASPQAMWQKLVEHQQKSSADALVDAIVLDLKMYFTSASERHAQIGMHPQGGSAAVTAAA